MIEAHFSQVRELLENIKKDELSKYDTLKELVKGMIKIFRANPERSQVALIEFPLEIPEILEYKFELINANQKVIRELFHDSSKECNSEFDKYHAHIIGPAFISLIYSHFFGRRFHEVQTGINYDDEFYDHYAEIISTIFLTGIKGVVEKYKNQNEFKDSEIK